MCAPRTRRRDPCARAVEHTPIALGTVKRNTVEVAQAVKDMVPKAPDAIVQISGRGVVVSQVVPFPFAPIVPISKESLDAIGKFGGEVKPNNSSIGGNMDRVAKVFAILHQRARVDSERELWWLQRQLRPAAAHRVSVRRLVDALRIRKSATLTLQTQGAAMPFFLWPMLFWMVVFMPFGMPQGRVYRRAE